MSTAATTSTDRPVTHRAEIEERVLSRAGDLRSLGVHRLGLFGSFGRDEAGEDSDVDFLVEFSPGEKSFDHYMDLAFLLEDLLHRRVELVTPEALSPYLGPHIRAEARDVPLGD